MTHTPPNFWQTVRLLLGAARKRARGRSSRQQALMNQRSLNQGRGGGATDWSFLSAFFAAALMIGLNVCAAFVVDHAVAAGQKIDAQRAGKVVVSRWFLYDVNLVRDKGRDLDPSSYTMEAGRIARDSGGSKAEIAQRLREAHRLHGWQAFVDKDEVGAGVSALTPGERLPAMLGSLVLLWWFVMLVFQGEGLEVDLQRRRHPLWEYLFAHPVPASAIFTAEMLAPLAANPVYWGAPLFAGVLYGFVHGPELGMLAALAIGIPLTVAAAFLGKALEIGAMLRFAPRTRGAVVGMMSWLGYTSMMGFLFALFALPRLVAALAKPLYFLATLPVPWPWLRWFVGVQADGRPAFVLGMAACWALAAVMIVASIRFSVWGAKQGLSGNFSAAESRVVRTGNQPPSFGKEPLYRKEFLWFARDRSAIVQAILVPLTLAATQMFNLRGIVSHAQGAWNYLCGAAILFGTYFLWVLGPKSLASEGSALWIALTWPRGLEALLKAKAWLWSLISSGIVLLVLCYAAVLFPGEIWKIALVFAGWFIFARSMAEKAVTLVTITSESGETQKIPWGRRGATQLGMMTFALGVIDRQWHIAIIGIVYSYITAAAIWQNFRARLPYLYDPWSETLPDPPTLMHAMVSISLLVEGGAILTGILIAALGRDYIGIAQGIGYAVCAAAVAFGASHFLENRGVMPGEVWNWPAPPPAPGEATSGWNKISGWVPAMSLGVAGGLALGLFAHGYILIAQHIPAVGESIRKSSEQMAKLPGLRISYAIAAVLFAPFAEEYLFRGLLYRALDREWGGWRAVVGSAAFFAIYHPPLSWIPVALVGAANALLFKRTGRLAPAIALHMVYNAVVVWLA